MIFIYDDIIYLLFVFMKYNFWNCEFKKIRVLNHSESFRKKPVKISVSTINSNNSSDGSMYISGSAGPGFDT